MKEKKIDEDEQKEEEIGEVIEENEKDNDLEDNITKDDD